MTLARAFKHADFERFSQAILFEALRLGSSASREIDGIDLTQPRATANYFSRARKSLDRMFSS